MTLLRGAKKPAARGVAIGRTRDGGFPIAGRSSMSPHERPSRMDRHRVLP
jgi:hypothetical protein